MGRVTAADDMLAVADRIRWVYLCRLLMLTAVPTLAVVVSASPTVVFRLSALSGAWLALTLTSLVLARAGRRIAVATLTVMLLGDGIVLTVGWHLLADLSGPIGMLVILYTMSVTLVTTFRTGLKMALWQSLLAILVLDAQAAGLLGRPRDFPVHDVVLYLGWLWAAVIATASLAAVNERELRRRRYEEKVLRELALKLSAEQAPGDAAMVLARFGYSELSARRAAVVIVSTPAYAEQLGPYGLAATVDTDGRQQIAYLPAGEPWPEFVADRVVLCHRPDPAADAWLLSALPHAGNVIISPFAAGDLAGALVLECPRRWPRRLSRRIERRLVATVRQAAAQSAAAIGRATAAAKLAQVANTDGLTGLTTRGRFDALLAERVDGSRPFSVILLDLDHFKAVNDTYGHPAGDAVLRGVAQALRHTCALGDVVARYGGEEIVVLTAGGCAEATAMAERMRLAVQGAETPVAVTASLGAANWPAEGRTADALIEIADRRLYIAKRSGRNRAVTSAADALRAEPAQP